MQTLQARAQLGQTATASPRLQQAVRLLQMSSLDFAAVVRQSLGTNPFLETDDNADTEADLEVSLDDHDDTQAFTEDTPPEVEAVESLAGDDRELWLDGPRSAAAPDTPAGQGLEAIQQQKTLAAHLHQQVGLLRLNGRQAVLAHAIVDSLDDDGYLRSPLEELATITALKPRATATELSAALSQVQSLEPAGVAARSVAECLQLQLPGIHCPLQRALAQRLIEQHLQTLADGDWAALEKLLQVPAWSVQAVCAAIRQLHPHPGWGYSASPVAYVVPDVLAKKVKGRWTVALNPAVVPKVRLNHVMADLFKQHRKPDNTALAQHLRDAQWTLHCMDLRYSTIVQVAAAIVERQQHFLDLGPMAMKPLALRDIAQAVGVHESTVSRVTNSKYMATPTGVFELKHFFSRALVSASGRACSGTAIRGLVEEMIRDEPPQAPLSDAAIARQLTHQGLNLARRTVTKYRQMLNIEAVDQRRKRSQA